MAILASKALKRIESTLGGKLRSDIDPFEIINQAADHLVCMHPWVWLTRDQTTLSMVKDQPFVELPPNLRHILAYDATHSLVNQLTFTSLDGLMRERTQRLLHSNFHFYAAITWGSARRPNLLLYTEDFTVTSWDPSVNAATVTANSTANPLTSVQNADTLDDASGANNEIAQQDVAYHLLDSGIYGFSCYLKAGTASETGIKIAVAGGTTQTSGLITWGATPTIALDSSAGTGSHVVKLTELANGWVRAEVTITYAKTEENGALRCEVYPAGYTAASTGTCIAWGAQLEVTRATKFARITKGASNTDATDYVATLGGTLVKGGEPSPQMSIWPVPGFDEVDKFSIIYAEGLPTISSDEEYISCPKWIDRLYLELVKAFARGEEEEDFGALDQRLQVIEDGPLFERAMERDGDVQFDMGPMTGGAAMSGITWVDWGSGATVTAPT